MTSVTASTAERLTQLRRYKMVSIDEDVAGVPSGATWYGIDSNKELEKKSRSYPSYRLEARCAMEIRSSQLFFFCQLAVKHFALHCKCTKMVLSSKYSYYGFVSTSNPVPCNGTHLWSETHKQYFSAQIRAKFGCLNLDLWLSLTSPNILCAFFFYLMPEISQKNIIIKAWKQVRVGEDIQIEQQRWLLYKISSVLLQLLVLNTFKIMNRCSTTTTTNIHSKICLLLANYLYMASV